MKLADWPPERSRAGARGTLPMLEIKDDHPYGGDQCGMCGGTTRFTLDSARWPVPFVEEAL